jgi:TPR repeat protein
VAESGDAAAQNRYGLCLKNGEGVARDMSRAARYFEMTAEHGDCGGQLNYACCLKSGEGVTKDSSKAA